MTKSSLGDKGVYFITNFQVMAHHLGNWGRNLKQNLQKDTTSVGSVTDLHASGFLTQPQATYLENDAAHTGLVPS